MSGIATREAFEGAILANAVAGRVGVDLTIDDFEIGSGIPLLVNCMPSGRYLMEDFCHAGGMPVILSELKHLLRPARTVMGTDIA